MSVRLTGSSILAALALAVLTPVAGAQQLPPPPQPATQEVVYKIHEDPNDPNSVVTFTVKLFLHVEEYDGNSIGWEIDQIRFREPGDGGADIFWLETDPNVPTEDGLWWIDHADRNDPQLSEFNDPPHLVGIAAAEDPNDDDLEYDFDGVVYEPPPGGPPWDPTAGLDYAFTLDGQSTPLIENTDEPVGIGEDDDPPPE